MSAQGIRYFAKMANLRILTISSRKNWSCLPEIAASCVTITLTFSRTESRRQSRQSALNRDHPPDLRGGFGRTLCSSLGAAFDEIEAEPRYRARPNDHLSQVPSGTRNIYRLAG